MLVFLLHMSKNYTRLCKERRVLISIFIFARRE